MCSAFSPKFWDIYMSVKLLIESALYKHECIRTVRRQTHMQAGIDVMYTWYIIFYFRQFHLRSFRSCNCSGAETTSNKIVLLRRIDMSLYNLEAVYYNMYAGSGAVCK